MEDRLRNRNFGQSGLFQLTVQARHHSPSWVL